MKLHLTIIVIIEIQSTSMSLVILIVSSLWVRARAGDHRIRYDSKEEFCLRLGEGGGRPGKETGAVSIVWRDRSSSGVEGKTMTQDEAAVQVLEQVQRTFLHLRDGKRRFFDPIRLVDACRCLNLRYSVNLQNDASEFCDKLLDRVESGMKTVHLAIEREMARAKTEAGEAGGMIMESESGIGGGGKSNVAALNRSYGGTRGYQKIPAGCSHRTNKSQPFTNLEVVISGKESLEESLASSVEAELMVGDNKVGETTRENERIRGSRFGSVGFGCFRIGSVLFSWF